MQVHWPLVVSTVCQRAGLGLFICAFAFSLAFDFIVPMPFVAAATLALLAVGGLASVFHLQRPQRFFNAFSNMGSHLTQEALITPFLGLALLACCLNGVLYDLGQSAWALYAATALLSAAFLACTGLAYQMGSRPAWNTPYVSALFLLTAFEAGALGVLLACSAICGAMPMAFVLIALVACAACAAVQLLYVRRMRSVGYGVNVDTSKEPFKGVFRAWLAFGGIIPAVGSCLMFALPEAWFVALVWASSVAGVALWTVLFFKGALKVKMFPMYPVDLNLDM